jgi:hypothetical protein
MKVLATLVSVLLMVACGGGGGSKKAVTVTETEITAAKGTVTDAQKLGDLKTNKGSDDAFGALGNIYNRPL